MSRDYAKRKFPRKKSKKNSRYLWLMLLLLFMGSVVGLVVVNKYPHLLNLSLAKVSLKPTPVTKHKQRLAPEIVTKIAVTPKFDFYNISPQKKKDDLKKEEKDSYELEIAIVNDFAAADRLKAELALLGFAASITPIYHQGAQKYSVSIGSYDSKDVANIDLLKLKQNNIKGVLKKSPRMMQSS